VAVTKRAGGVIRPVKATFALVLALASAACPWPPWQHLPAWLGSGAGGPPAAPMPPAVRDSVHDDVYAWLACIDCPPQLLGTLIWRVGAYPSTVLGQLDTTLFSGPDSATQREIDTANRNIYRELLGYVASRPSRGWFSRDTMAVVASYNQRVKQSWQLRAVVALGGIGTPLALEVLDAACRELPDTLVAMAAVRSRLAVDSSSHACRDRAMHPVIPVNPSHGPPVASGLVHGP
jgi:hypothetical protein